MKVSKKLFFVALLLSLIFSVGAVAAQENLTFEQSDIQEETDLSNDDFLQLAQEDNSQLKDGSVVEDDYNDFSIIQDKINNAKDGDIIFLDGKTYQGFSQINVTKKLTIVGGSSLDDDTISTLDGQGKSRIMEIMADNVVLKGISFVNGYLSKIEIWDGDLSRWRTVDPGYGGAIMINGKDCSINNCNFINNKADERGGAIYINGKNCNIDYCDFINNKVDWEAGAIFVNAPDCNISNSNFISNNGAWGGAIKAISPNFKVADSNFTNNSASFGGAIDASGVNFILINGVFTNNSAGFDNGAVVVLGLNSSIINSSFVNNSAGREGGAIGVGNNAALKGNVFSKNSANRHGGAIQINSDNVLIDSNNFYKNAAGGNGYNIWNNGKNNNVVNNSFFDQPDVSMGIYIQGGNVTMKDNEYKTSLFFIESDTRFVDFVGKNIQIPIYVYDYMNNPVSGTVTLYGYGDQILVNGKAMFIVNLPSDPKVLNSFVKYGDEIKNIVIESISRDPIMEVTQIDGSDDVLVKFATGATGKVIVNIKGVNYFAEIINGVATVKPAGLVNGNYETIVMYSGDDNYPDKWTFSTIAIKLNPVYGMAQNKDVSVAYSGKSTYKVLITKDGKAVGAGESVKITFNGKTVVVKTNAQGYAILNLNTNLKPGTYSIKSTYGGISKTNQVKITQIIKASDKKVKKSAKLTKIKISLSKVDGKFLKSKTLKVKFNGKTFKVKTNSKGVAIWKVKKSMLKKFKVGKKVQYTVNYGNCALAKKLTISK